MNSEAAAILTLLSYLLLISALLIYQAVRLPDGWRAWILFAITRVYAPGLWHVRRNRRCPFPGDSAGIVIANHRSPTAQSSSGIILIWEIRRKRCAVSVF